MAKYTRAGHVIEKFLGFPINSAQSPNFSSWELKTVPIQRLNNGSWDFKETMAITMINPENIRNTEFENSHLLLKLKKAVIELYNRQKFFSAYYNIY